MGSRVALRASMDRPGREVWPLLMLLLTVLVPTGVLLWFMNDAIDRQAAASHQAALEAFRSQLRLIRTRTEMLWRPTADHLDSEAASAESGAASFADRPFARLIVDQAVDGAIFLDAHGGVLFPPLISGARDGAADRELPALQRLPPGGPTRAVHVQRLEALVNDYDIRLPASQRLFLMGELRRAAPAVNLPTESALRLSIQVMESGPPRPEPGAFHLTRTPEVWALTSANRRTIGLYRTRRLQAMLDDALGEVAPRGVRFVAYPPDASGDPEAIAVGPSLPGWQVSFAVANGSLLDGGEQARLVTYLWVGFAGIGTVALFGLVAGQAIGRQLRVARLKTDLTAAVSHELRAPLASVRVLVDGLLGDETFDPVKTREYLELIAGEHERLSRVIENFLTFARLDRGRERFVLAITHPSVIVAAATKAIRDRMPVGCDLHVDVPADLPAIMADADALSTALVNLLDNALKFTPDRKRIVLRASGNGATVTFSVSDNGAGIPVGERRRIFRQFYRVDRRLARDTAGVGLGLSIVALIVRAHGGQIDVASELGTGATFSLRFRAVSGPS